MKKIIVIIIVGLLLIGITGCLIYINKIGPVTKESKKIEFIVEQGDTYLSIASVLKSSGLIKDEFFYKIYIKLNKSSNLEANAYLLDTNMGVKKIVETLSLGSKSSLSTKLTFKEGSNISSIIKTITDNTNNKKEDILELLSDKDYLNSLIKDYWFITEDIKNKNIYYSLEGYLFPDTYVLSGKDVEIKKILTAMLNRMDDELSKYKKSIKNSKYSIHELLTLASIVETEGNNDNDRELIAGVFYNRLNTSMKLGSCVTCYYGAKRDFGTGPLYTSEINDNNPYNTYVISGLPVGPIASVSANALKATIYPKKTDYYYFVSDINSKTYFTKTLDEHNNKIAELQGQGLWNE